MAGNVIQRVAAKYAMNNSSIPVFRQDLAANLYFILGLGALAAQNTRICVYNERDDRLVTRLNFTGG